MKLERGSGGRGAGGTDDRAANQYRSTFVTGLGFSNGCAMFALKNPPPFVPSISMGVIDATGPPGILCAVTGAPFVSTVWAATVEIDFVAWKFWMTP